MRTRKPIAALAAALAVWAWSSDEGWSQPRPPAPPMGGPPRPVMGPMGGWAPPRGISVPGGIGGAGYPPGSLGATRPQVLGPNGSGPTRPQVLSPNGSGPTRPQVLGPNGSGPTRPQVLGPNGSGPTRPQDLGRDDVGGRSQVSGLGGLGSLAKSSATAARPSTSPVSRQALAEQANRVRNNYEHHEHGHGYFRDDWWGRHRGAWRAARWAAVDAAYYRTHDWAVCYSYCGYYVEPVYYYYGWNVVYEREYVYINGDAVATQEQYAEQATAIADTGQQAQVTEDGEWLALGVFAVVQGEQTNSNDVFQLAVNKSGVIRGNYHNALSDTTWTIRGSVDARTQRAAWTVGDRKEIVYEAGFANLNQSETTMLVHFGTERTQQLTLVRLEQSDESKRSLANTDAAR